MSVSTISLDEFRCLATKARQDLSLNKTDTTMLKYLQGQVKDQMQDPNIPGDLLRMYAENNLIMIEHVYSQLKSNIDYKRTKTPPIKEINDLAQLVANFPGSIGFRSLSVPQQDIMFVNMVKMILGLLKSELNPEDRNSLYNSLFKMAFSHKDYLSRHPKVDRVIKAKIKELAFSEKETERMVGKSWMSL